MPSIWNKDERAAKRLLKNGHASMKDVLALSFGAWPPKGLDINPDVKHAQEIIFKPFLKEALKGDKKKKGFGPRLWQIVKKPLSVLGEVMGTAGVATLTKERVIYINKFICSFLPALAVRSSITPTLGHEAVHSLQGDNYYRAKEVFGAKAAKQIWAAQSTTTSELILEDLNDYEDRFHKNFLRRSFHAAARMASFRPGIDYLKTGEETQAFLHQAIVAGYKKWGKMPGNTEELWQALVSMGMKPPQEVKQYLQGSPAPAFRKRVHGESASNLKAIDRSLSDAGRVYLWTKTLPTLYSDLIEMFGDRQGRERFGLGANVKGQIQKMAFGQR